jgi:hypothetical protein
MKMTVTRPFLLGGQRQEIGTVVDIEERAVVAMLQHEGKATPAVDVVTGRPMTTDTTPGVVAGGKRKKGENHE